LIEQGSIEQAREWAETSTELLAVHGHAGQRERAAEYGPDALTEHTVEQAFVHGDTIEVSVGPFTGTHRVHEPRTGDYAVMHEGLYVHDETDVEFEAECPDLERLREALREVSRGDQRGDTARAVYRRTRL